MKASIKRYKNVYEAPEGGYGYVVCIGVILIFVILLGTFHCFGLIFNDFFKKTSAGTATLPMLNSVLYAATSVAGLFFNTLIYRFSRRTVGLLGAALHIVSGSLQLFASSVVSLYISFAFTGATVGILVPIAYANFNSYFVKRRVMMMSITQALIALGQMLVPLFIHYLLETFGFRGCLLILAAINAHSVVAVLLMQPIEWHAKRVRVSVEFSLAERSQESYKEAEYEYFKPSMNENEEKMNTQSAGAPEIFNHGKCVEKLSEKVTRLKPAKEKPIKKWGIMVNSLDLTLLKDPVYVNIAVGVTLAFYCELSFVTFMPLYLFELNYTQADTAKIMAIEAGADMVSRCVLAIASAIIVIQSRRTLLAGVIFSVVPRYGLLFVSEFWSMAALTGSIGFLRTWVHVNLPLVFAEYLPNEGFATGYGLFLFLKGMITFGIGPFIRFIHEKTGSYAQVFQVLNLLLIFTAVSWLLEMVWVKLMQKKEVKW